MSTLATAMTNYIDEAPKTKVVWLLGSGSPVSRARVIHRH